jgi:TfoX/Sxy family transcriptional regulator of competence genes
MAYDEGLAQRVRERLAPQPALVEKRMFCGIGFMVQGNMCCGVLGDELIVRVGPEQYPAVLAEPHSREFDLTGRAMKGWVTVNSQGLDSDRALEGWVDQGLRFALSLPPK